MNIYIICVDIVNVIGFIFIFCVLVFEAIIIMSVIDVRGRKLYHYYSPFYVNLSESPCTRIIYLVKKPQERGKDDPPSSPAISRGLRLLRRVLNF